MAVMIQNLKKVKKCFLFASVDENLPENYANSRNIYVFNEVWTGRPLKNYGSKVG